MHDSERAETWEALMSDRNGCSDSRGAKFIIDPNPVNYRGGS